MTTVMMTQPYLVAMEHAEWHAQEIIRKHHRNRPLGHIERYHHYTPPQPVLSCRSVNVDVSGTRTYRALSTSDIIDQQHKLIHNIYKNSRTATSAPVKRSRVLSSERPGAHALKQLEIQGTARPHTSAGTRLTSGRRGAQGVLRKRPQTAGSPRPKQPSSARFLRLSVDPEYELTAEAFHQINGQLKDQWGNPENHRLDEGLFVRGKKKEGTTSLDPKTTGGQWLTFGGTQKPPASSGIVDAFTAMKDTEEYYTIDGSTGSLVSRSLRPGDKIRVGVNGEVRGNDSNLSHWTKTQQDRLSRIGDDARIKPSKPVPLCWTDAVDQPNAKVVETSVPRIETPRPNLCETHPVIFKKLIPDNLENVSPLRLKSEGTDGFKVNIRSKPRRGMDGLERENSRITAVSIAPTVAENRVNQVTYDDILQTKLRQNGGQRKKPMPRNRSISPKEKNQSKAKDATNVLKESEIRNQEMYGPGGDRTQSDLNKNIFQNGGGSSPDPSGQYPSQTPDVRPTTAFSMVSQDHDLDSMVNVVSVGPKPESNPAQKPPISRGSQGKGASSTQRVMSAGRPPPAKSSLHLAAASGASIRSVTDICKDNTQFIQISTGIHVNREKTGSGSSSPRGSASPAPGSAHIDQVREHNKVKFGGDGASTGNNKPSDGSISAPTTTPEPPHGTPDPFSNPESTHPPSPPQSPDTRFAFNIPTADNMESEANSIVGDNEHLAQLDVTENKN